MGRRLAAAENAGCAREAVLRVIYAISRDVGLPYVPYPSPALPAQVP